MNKKNIVLLLTGTVNSSMVSFMKRNQTHLRLNDYIIAINKWINSDISNIVFVENSDFPEQEIKNKLNDTKRVEYLTYNGQDFSRSLGKGFGEINSFEYAFNNSKYLKNADYIIKCNGRYFIKRHKTLIQFIERSDVDIIGNFSNDLSFIDSRLFAFKPHFFLDYFIKYKYLINDSKSIFFEHALGQAAHELLKDRGTWIPLPLPLIIEGISGTDNIRYNIWYKSLKKILKFTVLKLINKPSEKMIGN